MPIYVPRPKARFPSSVFIEQYVHTLERCGKFLLYFMQRLLAIKIDKKIIIILSK